MKIIFRLKLNKEQTYRCLNIITQINVFICQTINQTIQAIINIILFEAAPFIMKAVEIYIFLEIIISFIFESSSKHSIQFSINHYKLNL